MAAMDCDPQHPAAMSVKRPTLRHEAVATVLSATARSQIAVTNRTVGNGLRPHCP